MVKCCRTYSYVVYVVRYNVPSPPEDPPKPGSTLNPVPHHQSSETQVIKSPVSAVTDSLSIPPSLHWVSPLRSLTFTGTELLFVSCYLLQSSNIVNIPWVHRYPVAPWTYKHILPFLLLALFVHVASHQASAPSILTPHTFIGFYDGLSESADRLQNLVQDVLGMYAWGLPLFPLPPPSLSISYDASRFLAQSQSRISNLDQPDNVDSPSRPTSDRASRPSRNPARSFLSRAYAGNPYQTYQTGGSRFGHLGFASRLSAAREDAPLFHSALNEYGEDDDEEERDREAADLFALQRSRRVAAASKLAESSETDPDGSRGSLDQSEDASHQGQRYSQSGAPRRGIRSSWNGTKSTGGRGKGHGTIDEEAEEEPHDSGDRAIPHGFGGDPKMVDVGLDSHIEYDDPPASLTGDADVHDDSPPAFQKFTGGTDRDSFLLRRDSPQGSEYDEARRGSSDDDTLPATVPLAQGEIFKYDPFFAWLFLILLAALLSTFVLVWLHTTARKGMGDTIYTTLRASFHMLAVDTVVSVMVALLWLAALRSFARPLTGLIVIAVPVVMASFSIYALVSSFKGATKGASLQDRALRWASLVPAAACVIWVFLVVRARHSIRQAVEILEFSSRILAANSALVLLGFGCLVLIVVWTWMWMGMFTRIFLGGYFSKSMARFVISVSSWWLGVWFVLMYMWSVGVINSVQRATTAATVSQWYFHRMAAPAPSSNEIVSAAFGHAVTTVFGSICQQTFLALLVRTPLLVLPRSIANILEAISSRIIPTPISALTNPLTITYGAIHSQNLQTSARGLSRLEFLSPGRPTTTLTPHVFLSSLRGSRSPTLPYRLSKMLLYATRFIMATALGFAGWVMTAKQLRIAASDGMGLRGSAYAYVVGIIASFIGFSVMGAMENILSGIVDAAVICYGSEKLMRSGTGGYCMEAAHLFGERRGDDGRGLP
ncbi:hypothetical protein ACRALDRAFT_2020477 [Sodiomyces alcalophilus JCM 7366]|uniref:uncharacterized protein n=1 Tax=Sodiomyces alcalophilus JCM 7366 TaxID=591952 RepID=UPI0039B64EE7